MKDFDSYLQRAIRTEPVDWSSYYVDYALLKRQLRAYSKRRKHLLKQGTAQLTEADLQLAQRFYAAHDDNAHDYFEYHETSTASEHPPRIFLDSSQVATKISLMERADFCNMLEAQLTKSAQFYKEQLENVSKSIDDLESQSDSLKEEVMEVVGNEILEVFCFMVVNVIALRQVLIRYDAFVRTHDGAPLSDWYLQRQLRPDDDSSETNLLDLKSLEELQGSFLFKLMQFSSKYKSMETYQEEFSTQFQQFRNFLDKTFDSTERAAGGHVVFRDRLVSTLRRYFLMGSVFTSISMEPKVLLMKGRHLKREMKQVAKWRENFGRPPEKEEDTSGAMKPENVLPLALNLISCFLFMMNNYIIEPSSAYYAEALGSSDALSGIMIGAAPWFALVSAVAYSFWTNHSYKQPIVFAACLMLIGNLMYANAYSYQSMEMCLLGRAITGLGAPRIINRRYVADATPFRLRTAASAAFALATALGAALGPGMAIVLDLFEFEFSLPLLPTQHFNGMTGPGYFMALSWTLYCVCILITFREPNRSGLDELRRREEEASKTTALVNENDDDSQSVNSEGDLSSKDNMSFDSGVASFDSDAVKVTDGENTSSPMHCVRHMTTAVALCMSLIFMKRIALESIMGSTSIITKNRYGWTIKNVGTLHTINGTIVIPVSILSGWLSQFHEDRYLAVWLMGVTLFGMAFLVDVSDLVSPDDSDTYNEGHWLAVGPVKYIAGSLIAFSGIEACESFVASLMSKVVPSALAVGTFNSGLLTTLVGTSGRATGDLFITAMGLISIRHLLNLLIIPGMALVIISIVLIRRNYELLAV